MTWPRRSSITSHRRGRPLLHSPVSAAGRTLPSNNSRYAGGSSVEPLGGAAWRIGDELAAAGSKWISCIGVGAGVPLEVRFVSNSSHPGTRTRMTARSAKGLAGSSRPRRCWVVTARGNDTRLVSLLTVGGLIVSVLIMAGPDRTFSTPMELMRWIGWAQRKAGEDWVRARELSFEQAFVLGYLRENPGAMQRDIAKISRTSAASVSSLLQGLERRGLVERRTEPGDANAYTRRRSASSSPPGSTPQWPPPTTSSSPR